MNTRTITALLIAALVVVVAPCRAGSAQDKTLSHGQAENEARKLWAAGDALRGKKDYAKAVKAYEKSLEVLGMSGDDKTTLGMAAKQMIELCKAMPIDAKGRADGTYEAEAWGYCAVIKIELKLEGGRIRNFRIISQKETREKGLEIVPQFILKRQSPSVDAVTRATVTSYGLMTATIRALQKAELAEKDAKTEDKKD